MIKNSPCSTFIPVLTTEAGRCLTVENWQAVGVNTVAYDLTALLMKPGIELLSVLPDLATYVGWQRNLVLNASMPDIDKDGGYTLRSEYDGSRKRYTLDEILALIVQLKPQMVILPEGIHQEDKMAWQRLPESILPFFAPGNLPEQAVRPYGVYFYYDAGKPFSKLMERIQQYASFPCYVSGELSLSMMQELVELGVQYLASDIPAWNGSQGVVYCHDGIISLKEETRRLDFGVIDEHCSCPTCEQKLTRAYLHHLLEHTPLLCQRFLIQHNILASSRIACKKPHAILLK